jgi:hypothetical protein
MLAIGNDELEKKPNLGDFILCKKCGQRHIVEYGDKVNADGSKEKCKIIAFVKCGENIQLVGINGKDIR